MDLRSTGIGGSANWVCWLTPAKSARWRHGDTAVRMQVQLLIAAEGVPHDAPVDVVLDDGTTHTTANAIALLKAFHEHAH